eukprot:scaffold444102_cov38-Prasinocladus_malaysianus.AAC.1
MQCPRIRSCNNGHVRTKRSVCVAAVVTDPGTKLTFPEVRHTYMHANRGDDSYMRASCGACRNQTGSCALVQVKSGKRGLSTQPVRYYNSPVLAPMCAVPTEKG